MTPLRAFSIGGTAMRVPTGDGHNTLHNLTVKFGSLVDAPANPGAHILLFKRDDETADIAAVGDAVSKVGRKLSSARKAALESARDQINQILAECEGASADKEGEDDMSKSETPTEESNVEAPPVEKAAAADPMAEAIQKKLDDLAKRADAAEAQAAELAKRAEAAEGIAKAERDARLTAEFITKAKAFGNLTVAADVLGPILKRANENALTAEDATELERILAAANEQVGKGDLTATIGKAGDGGGSSAWAKIDDLAKAHAAEHGVTIEKARVAVMKAKPELKAAYDAERAAQH